MVPPHARANLARRGRGECRAGKRPRPSPVTIADGPHGRERQGSKPDLVQRVNGIIRMWHKGHSHWESLCDGCESPCSEFTGNRRYPRLVSLMSKPSEIAIYSIVVAAIAYSALLWRIGSRADVLHGEFIAIFKSAIFKPKPNIHPGYRSLSEIAAADHERDLCERKLSPARKRSGCCCPTHRCRKCLRYPIRASPDVLRIAGRASCRESGNDANNALP